MQGCSFLLSIFLPLLLLLSGRWPKSAVRAHSKKDKSVPFTAPKRKLKKKINQSIKWTWYRCPTTTIVIMAEKIRKLSLITFSYSHVRGAIFTAADPFTNRRSRRRRRRRRWVEFVGFFFFYVLRSTGRCDEPLPDVDFNTAESCWVISLDLFCILLGCHKK